MQWRPAPTLCALLLAGAPSPPAPSQYEGAPPSPQAAEEPRQLELDPPAERPSLPKLVVKDIAHVVSRPFHWQKDDWLFLGITLAGAGAALPFDDRISDAARDPDAPGLGIVGTGFDALGDGRSLVIPGAFLVFGLIADDRKARHVAADGVIAGALASGLLNTTLAGAIGRSRPLAEKGQYDFHPGINTEFDLRSFPSGHVAQAFSLASVIATHYPQTWVRLLVYTAATGTAYQRMRMGKHFLSDVIVGASLGIATGQAVVRYNRRLTFGPDPLPERRARFLVMPMLDGRAYGLSGVLVF